MPRQRSDIPYPQPDLGRALVYLRAQAGKTQKDVYKHVSDNLLAANPDRRQKLSKSYLAYIENGSKTPTAEMLEQILKVLDIDQEGLELVLGARPWESQDSLERASTYVIAKTSTPAVRSRRSMGGPGARSAGPMQRGRLGGAQPEALAMAPAMAPQSLAAPDEITPGRAQRLERSLAAMDAEAAAQAEEILASFGALSRTDRATILGWVRKSRR